MKFIFCKIILMVFSFTLIGCSSKDNDPLVFDIDKEGNYIGFNSTKDFDNPKEAVKNGYYVKDNEKFMGDKHWKYFIDTSSNNENVSLRTVIMEDNASNNYIDLFYQDGLYYVFKKETNDIVAQGYKYLLTLESEPSNDGRVYYQIILSNDNTITYSDIFKDLTSSDKYSNGEKYKLVISGVKYA